MKNNKIIFKNHAFQKNHAFHLFFTQINENVLHLD